MRRADRKRTERLRLVVETLPYETRVAMLEGLRRYDIITGAYSERSGGVCPMLAAHRCGGRTDMRSFARAWDVFTGAHKRSRRASERELRTLSAQLEASLWREDDERYGVRAELDAARSRPRKRAARGAAGAWMLPARDWDGYRRTLEAAFEQLREQPQDPRAEDDASAREYARA
jgi:hypothetical protein